MKNLIKSIFFLAAFLAGNNLLAQNVSTGIDNSGNSVGIGNPDPNWVITAGPITGTSYMVGSFPGYWELTPVAGTNAGWINSNGTFSTAAGVYTLEREFEVADDECSFVTNFSVAYDDQLFLLELVPPSGPTISLGIPPAPGYQLSAPVVVSIPSPMPGTWKIRAVNNLIDGLGAFILSGHIAHFTAPACTQDCPCTNLVNGFDGNTDGCRGSFSAVADVPSCMQLLDNTWTVNNVVAGTGTTFNYTFPGNGVYTICFTTRAMTPSGVICETTTCHDYTVEGCCTCESLNPNFLFNSDRCTGLFEAFQPDPKCFDKVNYDWYINNLFVGTGQGFAYTFPGNGTYTACLRITATLPDGTICQKEFCRQVVIDKCDQPCGCDNIVVDFDVKTEKCFGTFTGGAIIPACMSNNVQFEWKVYGNPAGWGPTLNYNFPGNGGYVVCLTVHTTLPDGTKCERTICKDVVIENCIGCDCSKLTPDFSMLQEGCTGYFTGFVNEECGQNAVYNWSVDGNPVGSGQTFSYSFPGNGTYTVCLQVIVMINGQICENTVCREITIENCDNDCRCEELVPRFDYNTDACFGHFVADVKVPECMNLMTQDWYVDGVLTGSGPIFNHNFPGNGSYTICLKVTAVMSNGAICTQQYCKKIIIENCAGCNCEQLQLDFEYSIDRCAGNFHAFVFAPACLGTLNYDWSVDGNPVGSGPNYTHIFPSNGTYVVCLRVWVVLANGTICERRICKEVTVTDCSDCKCEDLIPSFSVQTDKCFGHFVASVHIPECMTNPVYNWYINGLLSYTGAVLNYNFPGNATYSVCLKVSATMPDGTICEQEICKQVTIVNCTPPCNCNSLQVGYTYDAGGCTIDLFGTATYPSCMQNIVYSWYVDNNYVGTGQNYSYTFPGNGTYVVCLRVTTTLPNGAKCEKEKCYTIVVEDCEPEPCNCQELKSHFKVLALGQCSIRLLADPEIPSCMHHITYQWRVNGMLVGTGTSLNYSFPGNGTYTICLMVTGTLPTGQLCERNYCYTVVVKNCTTVPPTGMQTGDNSLQDENVILYPNPATSEINLEFDLEKAQNVTITLKTMDGKRILSETKATEAGRQHFNIQIPSSTADGMILVEIAAGDRIITRKVNVSKQ